MAVAEGYEKGERKVKSWCRVDDLPQTWCQTRDTLCRVHALLTGTDDIEFALFAGKQTFDVIATAYERNSVLVTTNVPFENWTEVLGSERLTGATLDRLTHRCHILEIRGESY